nr:heparinase II/III family protein [Kribbella sandramycini]
MTEHWSGIRNHGTDESIALFGIGCTYNRADLKELAVKRLNEAVVHAIDDEGTTNEQSVGYASFNYRLWGRAAEVLRACKTEPGPEIDRRREKLALWLALATKANGELHQIGNTNKQKTETAPGTPLEFVASQGKKGTKPAKRTGIYRAGYIFGRTGWGDNRPFGQESSYSIRFGFPRAYHGHEDHTAITYNWHGRDVLIDPGYLGYRKNEKQEWARTQYAHNVMTIPTAKSRNAKTKLVGAVSTPNSDYYELNDQPAEGVDRSRDVLVLKDPDLVIALDRGQSGTTQRYETLWHLPPGHQVTVDANGVAVARQPRSGMKTHLIQIPLDGAIPAGSTTVEEGRSNPAQGWFAPTIFNPVPAPVVKFTRTGQSVRILSLIIPSKEAEKVTYTTRTTGTATLVDLAVGTRKVTVKVAPFGRLTRLN